MCSVNIGPVHLISFNSEYYYYMNYGWDQIVRQYHWLKRDLIVSSIFFTLFSYYHFVILLMSIFYC